MGTTHRFGGGSCGRRDAPAGHRFLWTAGDKTGTGEHGAVNDNAIIWPPQRPPILIAAYLSDSHASPETLDAAQARIGAIVATATRRNFGEVIGDNASGGFR